MLRNQNHKTVLKICSFQTSSRGPLQIHNNPTESNAISLFHTAMTESTSATALGRNFLMLLKMVTVQKNSLAYSYLKMTNILRYQLSKRMKLFCCELTSMPQNKKYCSISIRKANCSIFLFEKQIVQFFYPKTKLYNFFIRILLQVN